MAQITQIHRYPIKALSAESLATVTVTAGSGLPSDRRFALAHSLPDPTADSSDWPWQPPDRFLTLKRYPKLAALTAGYDEETGRASVTIAATAGPLGHPNPVSDRVDADILSEAGRASLARFVSRYLADQAAKPGTPELSATMVDAGVKRHLTDRETPFVSIINRASVDAILPEEGISALDAVRFRGNLVIDGWEPWAEASMIGRCLCIGKTRLRIAEPIGRCAATHVNPTTAQRDRNILKSLQTQFGHTVCGVYAIVEAGGDIAVGDAIAVT